MSGGLGLRTHPPAPIAALHVAALWGFAVAQPLYDLLGRHPDFFVAQGSGRWEVLGLVVVLSFLAPAGLALAYSALGRLSKVASTWLLFVVVGGCGALIVLHATRNLTLSPAVAAAAALVLGALLALGYGRLATLRAFLTVLSLAALVFPLVFLLATPVRSLLNARGALALEAPRARSTAPVVVVVFDELPLSSLLTADGAINAELYPHFADFSARSDWYPRATSVAGSTHRALPAILTGRYGDHARMARFEEHPENLFTLFAGSRELYVFENVSELCPEELCGERRAAAGSGLGQLASDLWVVYRHLTLPAALREGLPPVDQAWSGFGAQDGEVEARSPADRRVALEATLEALRGEGSAGLYYLHLMVPHLPWKYLPSGKEYGPLSLSYYPFGLTRNRWPANELFAVLGWQRHLLQVGYADRLLGELVDGLESAGVFDEALIAVLSDHGASFLPGERRRPASPKNFADVLAVPLMIKRPQQRNGRVLPDDAETIDLLPTLANALGFELPWAVDGRVLGREEPVVRARRTVVQDRGDKAQRLSFPTSEVLSRESVDRKVSLFGEGRAGLYTVGTRGELVGRHLDELDLSTAAGVNVDLEDEELYEDLDPASHFLPAHVVGRFSPSAAVEDGAGVLVAVNETVVATTRTFRLRGGETLLSAVLPEESFAAGPNRIDILLETDSDSGLLHVPRREMGTYALLGGEGVLAGPNGRRFEIRRRAIRGVVNRTTWSFEGWATDAREKTPAEQVLLFVDGELVLSAPTGQANAIARSRFGRGAERSGFSFLIPFERVGGDSEVRLVAISGDLATELPKGAGFEGR